MNELDGAVEHLERMLPEQKRHLRESAESAQDDERDEFREMFHGPLADTPEAIRVVQVPANHLYVNTFTVTATPIKLVDENPYRLRLFISKTGANSLFIAEVQYVLLGANGGALFPTGTFDVAYTGALWAISPAGNSTVGIAEWVRTPNS